MTSPPFIQSIPRQAFASGLVHGVNSSAGGAIGGGQLVVSTNATTAFLLQFPDLYDLSNYRQITVPDATPNLTTVIYDAVNVCFYAGVFVTTNTTKRITIYKLTPDGVITRLSNAVDTTFAFTAANGYSGMCTDGAFIYVVVAGGSGVNGCLTKVSCVDGSVAATIRLPPTSPSSTTAAFGRSIVLNGGNVQFGGDTSGNADPWVGYAPTSLATVTALNDTSAGFAESHCWCVVGGNVWIPSVGATTGLWKANGDFSSFVQTVVMPESVNGMSFDGTTLWCGGVSGRIYGVDPVGNTIIATRDEALPSGNEIRVVFAIPGALVAVAQQGTNVFLIPNGDRAAHPPLSGRGAC